MYRIGNEKRKIQSAKLICQALEQLMLNKKYDEITVIQIVEKAGVGRATFYRLFDDKSDVVLYQMESVFNEILDKSAANGDNVKSADELSIALFDLWLSHKNLFLSLIKANLYESFQNQLSSIIEQRLSFLKDAIKLDNRNWKYFIHIRSSMLFAALRVAITQYGNDKSSDIIKSLDFLFENQHNIINK
jgi:AcrR family transcriptional regulator